MIFVRFSRFFKNFVASARFFVESCSCLQILVHDMRVLHGSGGQGRARAAAAGGDTP